MGFSDRLRESAERSRERTRQRLEGLNGLKEQNKALKESVEMLHSSKNALREKSTQLREERKEKSVVNREIRKHHLEKARERAKQPKTKRGRLLERIHTILIGVVTTVLLIGKFWPASLFESWNFSDEFPGDFPMFFATFLIVALALWPLRIWMKKKFDKPDDYIPEKKIKESDLLDD